jgi:HSP20 family protein
MMADQLSRWEPFRDMVTLREAMNRLFEESLVRPWEGLRAAAPAASLTVDIYEKENELVVKAAVPGVGPDDLDITVTGDVLNIKGELSEEAEVAEEHYHRREFRYGSFCRSVRLPVEVDVNKVDATFKDGILTMAFPKPKEKRPKSITVKVKK